MWRFWGPKMALSKKKNWGPWFVLISFPEEVDGWNTVEVDYDLCDLALEGLEDVPDQGMPQKQFTSLPCLYKARFC